MPQPSGSFLPLPRQWRRIEGVNAPSNEMASRLGMVLATLAYVGTTVGRASAPRGSALDGVRPVLGEDFSTEVAADSRHFVDDVREVGMYGDRRLFDVDRTHPRVERAE